LVKRFGIGESTFAVGEYLEADEEDDDVEEEEVDEGEKEALGDPCVNPCEVGDCPYRASAR
jgi:hypothetical protein